MSGNNYRDNQRIDHMLCAIEALIRNSQGVTTDMLYTEDNLTKVLMYDLIILGEAANNISKTFAGAHPEIEWADIAGLRHKLVHDYAGVNYDILWNVISNDIPAIYPKIKAIHDSLPAETLSEEVSKFL